MSEQKEPRELCDIAMDMVFRYLSDKNEIWQANSPHTIGVDSFKAGYQYAYDQLKAENERLQNYVVGGYEEMHQELKLRLVECEKALANYSDRENWKYATSEYGEYCWLTSDDLGNEAREYFKKWGGDEATTKNT